MTFPVSIAFCENNTQAILLRHTVTLGVACQDATSSWSFYRDLIFECSETKHDFANLIDEYGIDGSRFSCSESAIFSVGSTQNNAVQIPAVGVTTDDFWLSGEDGYCWKMIDGPIPPPTPPPVTSPPESAQPTPSPTFTTSLLPNRRPTAGPVSKPTNPPAPFGQKEMTESPVSSSESSNGASIGAAIGGVAVGIALMTVIGYFVLRRMRSAPPSVPKPRDDEPATETYTGNDPPYTTPTTSMIPISPSLIHPEPPVSYKDQTREHADAIVVPMAVAVDMSADSAGTHSIKSEPPGYRNEDPMYDKRI